MLLSSLHLTAFLSRFSIKSLVILFPLFFFSLFLYVFALNLPLAGDSFPSPFRSTTPEPPPISLCMRHYHFSLLQLGLKRSFGLLKTSYDVISFFDHLTGAPARSLNIPRFLPSFFVVFLLFRRPFYYSPVLINGE